MFCVRKLQNRFLLSLRNFEEQCSKGILSSLSSIIIIVVNIILEQARYKIKTNVPGDQRAVDFVQEARDYFWKPRQMLHS